MAANQILSIIIEAVDNASGVADNIKSAFQDTGKKLAVTGAALGLAVAPVIGVFGDAANQASAFQESMTNAQAVLGVTSDAMTDISDQILEMGQSAREGPQAVADSYYDIVSGVSDASTHMAILQAAIDTSEAGASELGGTTSALVSIMNSYGFAAEDAAMVSDALTNTVGMGVLTMDELASAIPSVTGLASSLGIGFDELSGSMAFMTTKGFSASQAATQLQASMVSMLNPNETMTKALDELGVASGDALVQQYGLVEALNMVADTQVASEEGLAKTLGSTEALNAALALTGDGAEEFLDKFEDSMDGATDAAQQVQLGSFSAQMDLLNSNVDALRISIGMALLPIMNQLLTAIKPIVSDLVSWVRENPKLVQTVAMVVGGIAALAAVLTGVGAVLAAVGTAIGVLVSPIGLVIAALAGLGLAYKTNFLGFKDAVDDIWNSLKNFGQDLKDAFNVGGLEGVGQKIWDALKSGFPVVLTWIDDNVVSPIRDAIKNTDWGTKLAEAGDVLQTIFDALVTGTTVAGTWAKENIFDPIVTAITTADWGTILGDAASMISDILLKIGEYEIEFYTWVYDNILSPIITEVSNAPWGDILGNAANLIWDILQAAAGLAVDFAQWVRLNIVYPVIAKIQETDWATLVEGVGGFIWDILVAAAGIAVDYFRWVKDSIATPIITELKNADWLGIINSVGDILGTILAAVASAFGSFYDWVKGSVADPVIDELEGLDWGGLLATAGSNIMAGLGSALGDVGTWAYNTFVVPILNAIGLIPTLLGIGGEGGDGNTLPTGTGTTPEALNQPGAMPVPPAGFHYGVGGKGGQQPILIPNASQDTGGMGEAMTPYLIGRGAQPELFIPKGAGTFYPAGEYATAGATGRVAGGAGGGSTPVVQFIYQPLISLADQREAEYQIRPTIERVLRDNGVIP